MVTLGDTRDFGGLIDARALIESCEAFPCLFVVALPGLDVESSGEVRNCSPGL